jgi:superoxide dismutase, Cu-Zn family
MIRSALVVASCVACLSFAVGCNTMQDGHQGHSHSMMQTAPKVAVAEVKPSKAATTQPVMNNVHGTVTFTTLPDGKVSIVAVIMGLTPNSKHGFHIHENSDMSDPGLMSTGNHFNPDKHVHGGPTTSPVHAGDFGNLTTNAQGTANFELTVDNISLGGSKNNVLGKPVIVHAREDDLKSQPSGNAGARVAGGIIQMK